MRPLSTNAARRSRRFAAIAVIAASFAAIAPAPLAMAQPKPTAVELNPPVPSPPKTEGASRLITYLETVVLAGLIVGVNLIPSKRGHQD
jgi:hypothetical protein